jgi:hypothetical protein
VTESGFDDGRMMDCAIRERIVKRRRAVVSSIRNPQFF